MHYAELSLFRRLIFMPLLILHWKGKDVPLQNKISQISWYPSSGSVIALIVQLFFSYPIWKLRVSDWAIGVSTIIAAVSHIV